MYNKFFGFKEKPFKLVPNPEYLFLSKSHEEALGHLTYAISQGDGFVELTGEVGTGKTTLCRVFLENLDKSIEAAYIFNPKLDALQLLKAINDEFGIDATPDNTKDLIDRLNEFLINKRAAGQKVLVLIDEAQNLSQEVLEQLRLLSNLETTREKLLQIILVGQPELGDMLSSHQLRQLGQRITINCQLIPLTFEETKDYIRHRIALASHRAGPPFDKAAYRAIYEYSRGVPRLINIVCDRALLNAFGRNSFKITGAITKEAIRELTREKTKKSPWQQQAPAFVILAAIVVPLIAALLYYNSDSNSIHSANSKTYSLPDAAKTNEDAQPNIDGVHPDIDSAGPPGLHESEIEMRSEEGPQTGSHSLDPVLGTAANAQQQSLLIEPDGEADPVVLPETSAAQESSGKETEGAATVESSFAGSYTAVSQTDFDAAAEQFLNFLRSLNSRHSRDSAMLQTLDLWNQPASISKQVIMIDTDQSFFREAAEENELLVQPMATDADINLIQILNLPAILTFYLPNHAWPKYLALAGIDTEKAYFDAGDQGGVIEVDRRILLRFWSGEAHIVWKNFVGLDGIITEHSSAEAVKTLKMLLHDLAYMDDTSTGKYDAQTKQVIKDIQTKNGLNADGKVGPLTKIALYNDSSEFVKPSLIKVEAAETENGK